MSKCLREDQQGSISRQTQYAAAEAVKMLQQQLQHLDSYHELCCSLCMDCGLLAHIPASRTEVETAAAGSVVRAAFTPVTPSSNIIAAAFTAPGKRKTTLLLILTLIQGLTGHTKCASGHT